MKKKFNIHLRFLLCLMLIISTVVSCDDEEGSAGQITLQSFGPSPVLRGGELKFIGTNLDKVTSIVLPDNVEVTSFVSKAPGLIVLTVPEETMPGLITLKTPSGDIVTKTELGIAEPITITSISPLSVRPDEVVTIEGTYLNLISEIILTNNVSVTEFESQSQTSLSFKVPHNAKTGTLVLVDDKEEPNMLESEEELSVVLPAITSLAPAPVKTNSNLTITGTNLDLATLVEFTGGAIVDSSNFISQSATEIVVKVPANAQLGKIKVKTASEVNVESAGNMTLVVPVITAVTPNPAKPGTNVTVTGTDLDLITTVTFGNNKNGTIQGGGTPTSISVSVPKDSKDGTIAFKTNAAQTVNSPSPLTLIVPTITSFTPTSVETEANPSITIDGTNLDLVTKIIFAGGWEANVGAATASQITIPVVAGTVTGSFKMITTNGTEVTSADPLTIVPFVPNVTSAPTTAYIGSMITLTGTDMDIAADVIFPGGVKATKFGAKTSTTLEVFVPETVAAGTGKVKFVTFKNEVYETSSIAFKFPGVEPIVDPALVINNFDEAGHDLGWDNWGGNVELGNTASVGVSGKYLHGTNAATNAWTWIWGCNHSQLPKKSVAKATHYFKMDVKITKPIAAGANFEMEFAGTRISLGNLGGTTPSGGWITLTWDLASFGGLPATIPASGEWGMNLGSGTGIDITGLYIDNIRFQAK
jgi:hypothetical protein